MRHRWETTFQNAIGDKWSGQESRNPHYCDAGAFAQPASADLLIFRGIFGLNQRPRRQPAREVRWNNFARPRRLAQNRL